MALHVMDEANRCLQCKVPQCQKGCPIHTNIPEAIRLLKENKLDDAGRMLCAAWCATMKSSVRGIVCWAKRALRFIFPR